MPHRCCAHTSVCGCCWCRRLVVVVCPFPLFRFNGSSTDGYFTDYGANQSNSAHLIRNASIAFLDRMQHAEEPFFLYLPFQNIHAPYTCDPHFFEMYAHRNLTVEQQTMFGYITEMDAMVSRSRCKSCFHCRRRTS